MKLVSIITPCFNSALYIEETIKSIINQTYHNWELILIDDNSNDNTLEIINSFGDRRIKCFYNKENMGPAYSRNLGLSKAKGRFISFCDSDDIWNKNKLEIQLKFMVNNEVPISYTSYSLIDSDGRDLNKIIRSKKKIDYYDYLKSTIIGMSTSMIDNSKVKKIHFHDLRTRQDTYLWISLLKIGHKAYGIDDVLVKYRIHNNSISSNKFLAARRVWYLYYNLERLGLFKSTYYFIYYAINSLKKNIIKS